MGILDITTWLFDSDGLNRSETQAMHERFSVVCFVDRKVNRLVEELRKKIPPRVAVMPAHVTVKGSFVEPVSIPEI